MTAWKRNTSSLTDRREDEHGDEVRDGHEGVCNVGEVPDEVEGLGGSDVNDQGEYNAVDHVVFMGAEEVFPCFFAVVFPSEDGGECEEDDADGDDVCAYDADVRGECGDGEFDSLKGVPSLRWCRGRRRRRW